MKKSSLSREAKELREGSPCHGNSRTPKGAQSERNTHGTFALPDPARRYDAVFPGPTGLQSEPDLIAWEKSATRKVRAFSPFSANACALTAALWFLSTFSHRFLKLNSKSYASLNGHRCKKAL